MAAEWQDLPMRTLTCIILWFHFAVFLLSVDDAEENEKKVKKVEITLITNSPVGF